MKPILLAVLLLLPGPALIGCAGTGEGPGGSSDVSISAAFAKSRADSLQGDWALSRIRYFVSGRGMRTLTGTAPVEDHVVELALDVPNGMRRHFIIEALDANERVCYAGDAWQDLHGEPVTIVIEMAERVLDVSGDWLFHLAAADDAWEEGPCCMRITQDRRVLSVVGYDAEMGRMEGWGALGVNDLEIVMSFVACDREGTLYMKAATEEDTLSGTFILTGGCRDAPLRGSTWAERGACVLPGAEVSVRIAYFEGNYALDFFADAFADGEISSATVSGPHVESLALNYGCSLGACRWFALAPFGETEPKAGDAYAFLVQYGDGSSQVLSDSVHALDVGPPVPLTPEPGETVQTLTPAFSWQAPAWGCATWYHLIVRDRSEEEIWWPAIPGDTTSAIYNFDGRAVRPLEAGESYHWTVNAFDDCEHRHTGHKNFSGAGGGVFHVSPDLGE